MGTQNDYGMPFTDNSGDRKYNSQAWRDYFSKLIKNGVIQNDGGQCQVKPQGVPNKTVYVDTGTVFINGAMRIVTAAINLVCADNTSGNPRIDRIVARLDYADRVIEFAVKQGAPGASPVAPALQRDASFYELALADITLANGYSSIAAGVITDQRWDTSLCGASSMTVGVIPPSGLDALTVALKASTRVLYNGVLNVDDALVIAAGIGSVIMTPASVCPAGYLECNGAAINRTTYANLFSALVKSIGNFTMTIAAPSVLTLANHGFVTGDPVYLRTTGALPTGFAQNTLYYVTKIDANTFKLATTYANAVAATNITATGSQSGIHTAWLCPFGLGDGTTTFNIPDLRGEFVRGWDHGKGTDIGRPLGNAQVGTAGFVSGGNYLNFAVTNVENTYTGSANAGASWGNSGTGATNTYGYIRPRNIAMMFCIRY